MPFVIEQESGPSEVPTKIDSDPTTLIIVSVLFLIYFLRGFILTSLKFGLIAVVGLTLFSYIR
jgi:hypothetical protein